MELSGILCPRGKQDSSRTTWSEVVQQTAMSGRIQVYMRERITSEEVKERCRERERKRETEGGTR